MWSWPMTLRRSTWTVGTGASALVWVDKSRALKPDSGTSNKLTLIQGQAWLITDPAKGTEDPPSGWPRHRQRTGHRSLPGPVRLYKRQARNASEPEEKKRPRRPGWTSSTRRRRPNPTSADVLSEYAWYCAAEGIELEQSPGRSPEGLPRSRRTTPRPSASLRRWPSRRTGRIWPCNP